MHEKLKMQLYQAMDTSQYMTKSYWSQMKKIMDSMQPSYLIQINF